MMYTLRQKVVWFAISSRIFVLLAQCVFNAIIPDHDAEDVFRRPILPTKEEKFLDRLVDVLFGGLERWDAQYFLHIAEHGYVYENTLAFFPLFPITVRFLSICLNILTRGLMSYRSLLLITSVSLNTVCFVKAADALFHLSIKVLDNEAWAYKAALLFCINPASIFFSAPYSEAMFVLLSFQGMRHSIDRQYSKLSAIPFGLAAAARSNGVLNVGFIIYCNMKQFISEEWPILSRKRGFKNKLLLPLKIVYSISRLSESCIIALAPFMAYQVYCYVLFCTSQKLFIPEYVLEYGRERNFILPQFSENFTREPDHWCYLPFPLAYSYVQNHYWNVGFLRYYQWKQFPNFILAAPIVFLVLWNSKIYFLQNKHILLNLGLKLGDKTERSDELHSKMPANMFVFVVHVVFLTIFCMAFVHIQVATRMICSASPVPYWFAGYMLNYRLKSGSSNKTRDPKTLVTSQLKKLQARRSKYGVYKESSLSIELLDNMNSKWQVILLSHTPNSQGKWVLLYFSLYALIGTVLFSNFLPWT